jgi:hypothetical protein
MAILKIFGKNGNSRKKSIFKLVKVKRLKDSWSKETIENLRQTKIKVFKLRTLIKNKRLRKL